MKLPRHIRQLLRAFPGATAERTRSGHYKVRVAPGAPFRVVPGTPGDRRGAKNDLAGLRRVAAATIPLAP